MKKSKKNKYVKFRHKLVFGLLRNVFSLYMKITYHYSCKKFKDIKNRPYLILFNHQTGFDQFFVAVAFKKPLYIVATEDIFSMGFISKVIKFLVHPIAFKKSTNDSRAVIECMKIAKEGGSIALAPEGNRTYSGETGYIKPSIAKLAQRLGLPIALFNIKGGFAVKPRFADKIRKGKVSGEVVKVLEYDEIKNMDTDELNNIINQYLYVDESKSDQVVKSKHLCEYLERAMYVCPKCGLSEFKSKANKIKCLKCGIEAEYKGNNEFTLSDNFKFNSIKEWYKYQEDFINNLNLEGLKDVIYYDKVRFSEVIVYKKKNHIDKDCMIKLYNDKITVESKENYILNFTEVNAMSVLGKNKLNIYTNDKIYQVKGDKRFNALKYMNIYYRYHNLNTEGEEDSKYLGI